MRAWILIALLAACGAKSNSNAQNSADSTPVVPTVPSSVATVDAAVPPAPAARPAAAVEPGAPLGEFAGVVASDGQARSVADLRGHPTVVWFFPFAGTPG